MGYWGALTACRGKKIATVALIHMGEEEEKPSYREVFAVKEVQTFNFVFKYMEG